jgi:polyisoprenoid-binding protein YceI
MTAVTGSSASGPPASGPPASGQRSRRLRRILKIGIPVLVVLIALAGFGLWWFVLRDDAPPAASLVERPTATTVAGATADGTWTVQPGPEVFAGYRVQELLAGETIKKTAAGRSPAVSGTITVGGTAITAARIDVDTTQLKSDRSQRDNRIRTQGLETDTFPSASFELSQPVQLGSVPAVGAPVKVQAVGNLTLHGVTRPATFDLDARWNGDTIDVAGSTPVTMADFQINPPSIGGFVSVDDNGTVELQLTFVRS